MKPILFNTDMVRAILDGRKTVTRRAVKPQPIQRICYHEATDKWFYCNGMEVGDECKPPYHFGDILYVRETWAGTSKSGYVYRADKNKNNYSWRPSIHMPREAARIFLRVTDVRVERLQDITAEQILDEGVEVKFLEPRPGYISLAYTEMRLKPAARKQFSDLWDSTIKKSDCALYNWDANPLVWVIEFERCEKPEEG